MPLQVPQLPGWAYHLGGSGNCKRGNRHADEGFFGERVGAVVAAPGLIGAVGAIDAAGGAPEPTAMCVIGGASTISLKTFAREGVDIGWADADRTNLDQLTIVPDQRLRTSSLPTAEGARFLSVVIAYSSSGTAHGGNVNLEVACT